ncbi:GntR family transcriptional regulator [Nocardia sp. NPDC052278]|uniref:GntR family transcriptional regulator n=1 Tax=Nocardia sp. NPDC052278 TaxID=3364328 RepID=UPI0037C9CF3D
MTRVEAVAQLLRQQILSGELAPGEPIKDAELANRLQVSITPVREAVAQLIKDGLIEALPNKRRQVTALTLESATELMDTLGILLTASLRRAIPHLDGSAVAELRTAIDDYGRATDARDTRSATVAFDHFVHILTTAAGNRELTALVDTVATRSYRLLRLGNDSPLWQFWLDNLTAVVTLLENEKYTRAVTRLEKHFSKLTEKMRADERPLGFILQTTAGREA